jgi:1-acyl-sn-glycerol-3-phosphate acyltransferase
VTTDITTRRAPHAAGAELGRRIGVGLMFSLWRPRVLGAWRIPPRGPVILAPNHSHALDGPMLVGTTPRPVHFLVKQEAFVGPLDPFLRRIGQLPVDRSGTDRTAITSSLDVLRGGGVLGIFPEGTRGSGDFSAVRSGLAYFALRTGAQVVPVACLGTTEPGRLVKGLPPLRTRVDVVYGEPFTVRGPDGARAGRKALAAVSGELRERLAGHLTEARRLTGRDAAADGAEGGD